MSETKRVMLVRVPPPAEMSPSVAQAFSQLQDRVQAALDEMVKQMLALEARVAELE